jgi:hypothetical protein
VVLATLLVSLSLTRAQANAPAPAIDWPQFFAHVGNEGLVYSDVLKSLEGKRVRLRGYTIYGPAVPGGLLLGRNAAPALHDVDEIEVPYDAVGVLWRKGLKLPPPPAHPTVEGILRLGNHDLGGGAIVAILIDDATPVTHRP